MPSKPKAAKKVAKKPAAPARLGDDLPAALPGEPLNIIVARTHVVGGKVRIELPTTGPLRARRGQKVQVKHVYRLEEDSPEKEEYRVLLRSNLGGKEHAPAIARVGDIYAVAEDVGGYLVHDYVVTGSNTQILTFEVGAEYVVGGWKDSKVTAFDQKQMKGEIHLIVS